MPWLYCRVSFSVAEGGEVLGREEISRKDMTDKVGDCQLKKRSMSFGDSKTNRSGPRALLTTISMTTTKIHGGKDQ